MSLGAKAKSKIILSHPGCPPFVQHAARALDEAALLKAYVTTFTYQPQKRLGQALRLGLRAVMNEPDKQLARRRVTEVAEERVITHPTPELLRMLIAKLPLGAVAADIVWERTELWFDRTVARKHLNMAAAVYGYENAALQTFRAQRERAGQCFYDLPICHHKMAAEILAPELEQFPETQTSYDRHLQRMAPQRNERKDEELRLADHVFVASGFTKRSLLHVGVPENRISVVPYGAPPVTQLEREPVPRPFIFLCAGTQSVRKGVHYLLEAWRRLGAHSGVELWLIGHMQLPLRLLADLPGTVVIRPSVTKPELFELYRRAGALVFPSLVEGFGMVITEAMANGLPVITTPNTAGPELIEHGRNGFIVPIRAVERLAATMQWCLDNLAELQEVGRQAKATAAQWQWSDYRTALSQHVSKLQNS